MNSRRVDAIAENFTHDTAAILIELSGKSLVNAVVDINRNVPGITHAYKKRVILDDVNQQLGTKYEMKHIDNWVAGRANTPKRIKLVLQLILLQYLFADECGQLLHDILKA